MMPPARIDEADIALALLFTTRPTDRALTGWSDADSAMSLLGNIPREGEAA